LTKHAILTVLSNGGLILTSDSICHEIWMESDTDNFFKK
jgi:hypothetical protein